MISNLSFFNAFQAYLPPLQQGKVSNRIPEVWFIG